LVTKPLLWSALIPLGFGITIEWLQGITSNLRTSDAYDIFANVSGMIFAILFLNIVKNVKLK
jgi:glycopeptide antibiotics resistance protein